MPFRTYTWEQGELKLGTATPDPELRQIDKDSFLILKSFCYRAPDDDPDQQTVYLIPGADFGDPPTPVPSKVVVPPDTDGDTDLASVPSIFWWLVASYGNHTRAALLHDALYVEEGEPPVPRRTADRLFLAALRESPDKPGRFRHWLMWAAVSAFGNMPRRLGLLFAVHVVAVWALTIAAVTWAWGDKIGWISWTWWQAALVPLGALVFLALIGSSWRAGVDIKGGWLAPMLLGSALILVPLANEWTYPFELELSPFTLLVVAAALMLVGLAWGLWVDPTLRYWLWPTALIALPLALIPAVLIFIALVLVMVIDLGAAVAVALRQKQSGEPLRVEMPTLGATQTRV
jgi:Protein of unknown function (DUF1353)